MCTPTLTRYNHCQSLYAFKRTFRSRGRSVPRSVPTGTAARAKVPPSPNADQLHEPVAARGAIAQHVIDMQIAKAVWAWFRCLLTATLPSARKPCRRTRRRKHDSRRRKHDSRQNPLLSFLFSRPLKSSKKLFVNLLGGFAKLLRANLPVRGNGLSNRHVSSCSWCE